MDRVHWPHPDQWPLLEREPQLRAVDGLLDSLALGRGGALLFEAGPGLGKSRLLDIARRRAADKGVLVLSASGSETEQSYPYGVVLQLFEHPIRAGIFTAEAFAGPGELSRPLFFGGAKLDATPDSIFPLLHGLYWLTCNTVDDRPVLFVVDDLHWCDVPSRLFLRYLGRRISDLPVAMVLAGRSEDPTGVSLLIGRASDVRTLPLAPLSEQAVLRVVTEAWHGRANAELAEACRHATGGNPFYLRELLNALEVERETVGELTASAVENMEVSSVARSLLFRIAALGPEAGALVRAAAVFDGRGSARAVAAVAGLDARQAARYVDALIALDVFAASEAIHFVHPLARAAVYGDIPQHERAELHQRVADALAAAGASPAQVAAHLLRAPAHGSATTVATLRSAATTAMQRAAFAEAAAFLARALDEPPPSQLRHEILIELCRAEVAAASDSALGHLDEAIAESAGAREQAMLRQLLGRHLHRRGRTAEAAEQFARALGCLGAAPEDDFAVSLRADFIAAGMFDPDTRDRARAELVRVPQGTASTGARHLLAHRALYAAQEAEPADEVVAVVREAWSDGELLEVLGVDDRSWLLALWALILAQQYAFAVNLADRVIELAGVRGSSAAVATASYFRGVVHLRTGALHSAIADINACLAGCELGWREYVVGAHSTLAETYCEVGDLHAAEIALRRAAGVDHGAAAFDRAAALVATARYELAVNRPDQALGAARKAGALVSEQIGARWTVLPWRTLAAEAAVRTGDHEVAAGLLDEEAALAARAGATITTGRVRRLRGLLARDADELRQAAALLASTPARLEYAITLVDLGATLRRTGQRSAAREPLLAGAELAAACGAGRLIAAAEAVAGGA
jgi:tetratricopeptide (TPR) repeat protein